MLTFLFCYIIFRFSKEKGQRREMGFQGKFLNKKKCEHVYMHLKVLGFRTVFHFTETSLELLKGNFFLPSRPQCQ